MFRAPLCPSSGAHDDSVWLQHRPSGSRVAAGWRFSAGRIRTEGCYSLRSGHSSILAAISFQPAATREPDALCGNQRYRRELLMMGIMVPEIC